MGYGQWSSKESDTTELLNMHALTRPFQVKLIRKDTHAGKIEGRRRRG